MSKQNNVNPDYYKVAGERPGKANSVKVKARSTETAERARWSERKKTVVRALPREDGEAGHDRNDD